MFPKKSTNDEKVLQKTVLLEKINAESKQKIKIFILCHKLT